MNSPGQQRRLTIAHWALIGVSLFLLIAGTVWQGWGQEEGPSRHARTLLNGAFWQGAPIPLGVFTNPVSPGILFSPDGAIHLIWEDDGQIYHAWRDANGAWHTPQRVFRGLTPSLAIDNQGQVHMVFAQNVVGNFEIYYTRFNGYNWTLPRNVSHTPGHSYSPYISIAPDGSLHVVWNERVSSGDIIYHANLDGATWVDFPIPSAWGKAPVLHLMNRVAHVLWQGPSLSSAYDIYYVRGLEGTWQLPQNLSDTANRQSVGVDSVVDARGWIHAVWLEEARQGYRPTYTFGNGNEWQWPAPLSKAGAQDVSIAASERGMYVHVLWSDMDAWWTRWRGIASPQWSDPVALAYLNGRRMTMRFAPQNDERLRAIWRVDTENGAEMWYGEANTPVIQRLFFAHLGRNAPLEDIVVR